MKLVHERGSGNIDWIFVHEKFPKIGTHTKFGRHTLMGGSKFWQDDTSLHFMTNRIDGRLQRANTFWINWCGTVAGNICHWRILWISQSYSWHFVHKISRSQGQRDARNSEWFGGLGGILCEFKCWFQKLCCSKMKMDDSGWTGTIGKWPSKKKSPKQCIRRRKNEGSLQIRMRRGFTLEIAALKYWKPLLGRETFWSNERVVFEASTIYDAVSGRRWSWTGEVILRNILRNVQ
jgi:hypothetical protein